MSLPAENPLDSTHLNSSKHFSADHARAIARLRTKSDLLRAADRRRLAFAGTAWRTSAGAASRLSPEPARPKSTSRSPLPPTASPALQLERGSAVVRVLLVDAFSANLPLLATLEGAGHDFLVSDNGWSALSVLHHTTPDLILIGNLHSGMDAATTCRRIKARPECRDIPVIFVATSTHPAAKQNAFDAGAIDYVASSAPPSEILARIAAHLKARATQRALVDELSLRIAAEEQLKQSLDRAVILTDAEGHIVFSTRLADALLQKHFGDFSGGVLPGGLLHATSPLFVRCHATAERSPLTMFTIEEKCEPFHPSALMPLGITRREAEVLFWVAQGKSNADIALLLGASIRTVHKHVENIFRKLGCETRTAAAFAAATVFSTSPL